MTARGRGKKTKGQQKQKPIQTFKLTSPVNSSSFSHFLPNQPNTIPVWPTTTFAPQPSAQPQKRKRTDVPQWRQYPKRSRAQVSYADAENSDDSAFYDSDSDGEGIVARKKAKVDRPLPKRKVFPFLSLPRELRDMIYTHVLTFPPSSSRHGPLPLNICARTTGLSLHSAGLYAPTGYGSAHPPLFSPHLLGVSRQVYAEASAVLYGTNPFSFVDSAALHAFVTRLSRPTRGLLRDMTLDSWPCRSRRGGCAWVRAAFAMMAEGVTGVRAFAFEPGTRSREPKREARRVWRLMHPWLEAVARERVGGVEAVVAVLESGVGEWGVEWGSGTENWGVFRGEVVRLMGL